MLRKIIATLLLIILLATPLTVTADKVSELEDEQDEVENELQDVLSQKSQLMKEINKISNSIADNEDKLYEIKAELIKLEKEIKQLEKQLKAAEERFEEQENSLKEKIVMDYEMGEISYLDVLLNSTGILDFLSNYYLISEIMQKDNELLEAIETQKNNITADKEELEEKQKRVEAQKAEQEAINVLLTSQKAEKQTKINKLSKEEKELQAKIDEYDELIKEEEKKASEMASGSTGVFVGGKKVWPAVGQYRITSGYGKRNTGIPGASTNHKGIDIGCPDGTKIVSVLDGKVMFTGYNKYRGYYIMVDHGGGVVTLYQHCSGGSFKFSVGQKVKAGETIVLSGHSGIGSGPHLHFEVLINGSNVNPKTWLESD